MAHALRHRKVSALVSSLAMATFAGSASAEPRWQGTGEAEIGVIDTNQSEPVETLGAPPEGSGGMVHSTGGVVMLAPGISLGIPTPRAVHRFGYRYQHDFLVASSVSSSSASRLDYRGFVHMSPRVSLLVDAAVIQANRFSSFTFAPPGTELLAPLPVGGGSFLQGSASQTFTFDVALGWRAWQGASVGAETPILGSDGARTFSPGARAGIERTFRFDAVGVEARANYLVVEDGVLPDGTRADTQLQLVSVGVATWRHDWGRDFASRVEAGVLRLDRLDTGTWLWSPTGTAGLSYATEHADADLAYTHTVTTNPVLGHTLLVDRVRLRGGVPLTPERDVVAVATLGYQHGRLVTEDANLAANVDSWVMDAVLGWQATRALRAGIRYQHIDQRSDVELPGLPARFVQNAVMLSAMLVLPPDADLPRAYRAPRRVDESDEIKDTLGPAESEGLRSPDAP